MKSKAKITLVQFEEKNDLSAILSRMRKHFEQAKEEESDIIVFPEFSLGRSISISHENVKGFMELAKEFNIYAVGGLVELHGTKWATTAIIVDRDGNLLGRYLKVHPASGGNPHCFPPVVDDSEPKGILGTEFKVFHLDFGTVGIIQCYDGYFPESWGCTAYNGAEIILWINGRAGMVEDPYCISAAHAYGVVVGGNISNGRNTGFAAPRTECIIADGEKDESRLFPRIKKEGDSSITAVIDMDNLRCHRKHLRTMHQRRPELYHRLVEEVRYWENYPEIPWDHPECEKYVNKVQL